ncbi:MAG TPA: response regulator [Candidatus Paceibacterota bacterium]|nr:response regulator [Verrucomicrobiota bacterium]HRY49285.1 response regulator [Candidatus Paceibacterota bacterium]HSA01067.1 response regulator [Candidatus Paceibacterota bacterium]
MAETILIVDDQPFMVRLIQFNLERAGFQIISARNGREAIEQAEARQPDLIVMDVMMSEMDGLKALGELKRRQTTQHIPVILITAKGQTLTRQEAEAQGAALLLSKPFSPTLLQHEIRRLLAGDAPRL